MDERQPQGHATRSGGDRRLALLPGPLRGLRTIASGFLFGTGTVTTIDPGGQFSVGAGIDPRAVDRLGVRLFPRGPYHHQSTTEPGRIFLTISSVTKIGAFLPGTKAVVITISAWVTCLKINSFCFFKNSSDASFA